MVLIMGNPFSKTKSAPEKSAQDVVDLANQIKKIKVEFEARFKKDEVEKKEIKVALQVTQAENKEMKVALQVTQAENKEIKAENKEIKAENKEIKAENKEIKAENKELIVKNEKLTNKIDLQAEAIIDLRKQNAELTKTTERFNLATQDKKDFLEKCIGILFGIIISLGEDYVDKAKRLDEVIQPLKTDIESYKILHSEARTRSSTEDMNFLDRILNIFERNLCALENERNEENREKLVSNIVSNIQDLVNEWNYTKKLLDLNHTRIDDIRDIIKNNDDKNKVTTVLSVFHISPVISNNLQRANKPQSVEIG
jgi:hypothetical protein